MIQLNSCIQFLCRGSIQLNSKLRNQIWIDLYRDPAINYVRCNFCPTSFNLIILQLAHRADSIIDDGKSICHFLWFIGFKHWNFHWTYRLISRVCQKKFWNAGVKYIQWFNLHAAYNCSFQDRFPVHIFYKVTNLIKRHVDFFNQF